MSIGEIWRRLQFLFPGNRLEQHLHDELRLHRDLRAAKLRRHGLPEEEAAYAARRKLGNETRTVEEARGAWTFAWLEAIIQDLRYAARVLRKSPAFAVTAVVTLGLGLGLNATLFTIFNAYVLRPLAMRDPLQPLWGFLENQDRHNAGLHMAAIRGATGSKHCLLGCAGCVVGTGDCRPPLASVRNGRLGKLPFDARRRYDPGPAHPGR